jgi:hypothetical protein
MIKKNEGFSSFDIGIMIAFIITISTFLYFKYNQDKYMETKTNFIRKGETHYMVLGVDEYADKAEISRQYRALSKKWYCPQQAPR